MQTPLLSRTLIYAHRSYFAVYKKAVRWHACRRSSELVASGEERFICMFFFLQSVIIHLANGGKSAQ
jgi:hypothetical protein